MIDRPAISLRAIQILLQDDGRRRRIDLASVSPVAFQHAQSTLGLTARQPFVCGHDGQAGARPFSPSIDAGRPAAVWSAADPSSHTGRPTTMDDRPSSSRSAVRIRRPRASHRRPRSSPSASPAGVRACADGSLIAGRSGGLRASRSASTRPRNRCQSPSSKLPGCELTPIAAIWGGVADACRSSTRHRPLVLVAACRR